MLGRSSGVVLMAPPSDVPEGRAAINTLLSAIKPNKHKVGRVSVVVQGGLVYHSTTPTIRPHPAQWNH